MYMYIHIYPHTSPSMLWKVGRAEAPLRPKKSSRIWRANNLAKLYPGHLTTGQLPEKQIEFSWPAHAFLCLILQICESTYNEAKIPFKRKETQRIVRVCNNEAYLPNCQHSRKQGNKHSLTAWMYLWLICKHKSMCFGWVNENCNLLFSILSLQKKSWV